MGNRSRRLRQWPPPAAWDADPGPVSHGRGRKVAITTMLGVFAFALVGGAIAEGTSVLVGALALGLIGVGVLGAVLARRDFERPAQGAALLPPVATARPPGFLQRLRERIDPPRPPDPDDWVVLAVVPFSDGPMLHSAVEGAGIPAVLRHVHLTPPGHGFDRYEITVRYRDLPTAMEIREDLRGPGLPPDRSRSWSRPR